MENKKEKVDQEEYLRITINTLKSFSSNLNSMNEYIKDEAKINDNRNEEAQAMANSVIDIIGGKTGEVGEMLLVAGLAYSGILKILLAILENKLNKTPEEVLNSISMEIFEMINSKTEVTKQ
jgi:hypothetical protein